jgi:hypothetical protein
LDTLCHVKGADRIANTIEDSDDKAQALSSIAQLLAKSNRVDEAIKAADAIKDSYQKLEALSSIAQFSAGSNKLD